MRPPDAADPLRRADGNKHHTGGDEDEGRRPNRQSDTYCQHAANKPTPSHVTLHDRAASWHLGGTGNIRFDNCLDSFGEEIRVVEMLRVVRPRGVVGIAQWTGEGFFGAYVELIRRFTPGPDGGEYRPDLGQEDFVRTSLTPFAESIGVQRRAIRARFATAESFCDELLRKDPYVRPLQAAVASERWEAFSEELGRLVPAWNAADDSSVLLELKYQLTVAIKSRT